MEVQMTNTNARCAWPQLPTICPQATSCVTVSTVSGQQIFAQRFHPELSARQIFAELNQPVYARLSHISQTTKTVISLIAQNSEIKIDQYAISLLPLLRKVPPRPREPRVLIPDACCASGSKDGLWTRSRTATPPGFEILC